MPVPCGLWIPSTLNRLGAASSDCKCSSSEGMLLTEIPALAVVDMSQWFPCVCCVVAASAITGHRVVIVVVCVGSAMSGMSSKERFKCFEGSLTNPLEKEYHDDEFVNA
eukprot:3091529-Amphidinium_carterae.1